MTIYEQLQEFNRTKSLTLAVNIVNNLKNYHILSHEEFNNLTEMASLYQANRIKHRKGAYLTNKNLTPEQLSERNRKAAIARWNKVKNNKLIKDIK